VRTVPGERPFSGDVFVFRGADVAASHGGISIAASERCMARVHLRCSAGTFRRMAVALAAMPRS
jgi:hypothetical protein